MWIRPDNQANQDLLVPDILTNSEDVLDVAIEFLENMQHE